ncbi:MAG: hypothetical protein K2N06_01030 [Oscillospiraceae bacterium]|nr:hypothetical protein [Oscillospiraceae bacterium]
MEKSKNSELQSPKNPTVKGNSEGFSNKIKFPLWLYPKTMEEVNYRFTEDNCGSRSEFIEKAINFYIGFLKQEKNVNYLSPRITSSVDAVVHGAEQRINRNLFKIAVELGKISHTLAATNDVDEDTLRELHAMCVDEVRHINGVINFESAVKFQNE